MNNKLKLIINKYILFIWNDRFKFESDFEVSRKLMMLNVIYLACILFLVPFGFHSTLQGNYLVGLFDLSAILILSGTVYYYKKTLNYIFLTYLIILLVGSLFLFLLFTAGVDYSGPLWSYLFPVSVMFMLGREKAKYFVLGYFLIAITFFETGFSPQAYSLNFKLRFLGSFAATSIISYYVEYIRDVMHKLLQEKNADLEESLKKLGKKEKELTEKELYYRTLFEASTDAIFIMDGGVFKECNPKTFEIFGCKKEEIINQSPAKFSPEFQPSGRKSAEMALEKINAALNGEPQFFEWVHLKLNGRAFNAEVSLDPIELDNQRLLQATVRDITVRKISEEELRIAKEHAENSDRLKSDFLAQMSHEIRTPINTIMNYTSLLKMEFENNVSKDNEGSFASIQNAAHRLLRTIDLILNISDLEAGTYDPKYEKNDLSEDIIIPVVNEFKQAAGNKNLSLIISNNLTEKAIAVLDNYTVNQIIANLIDNAIKYTQNGEIVISLEKEKDLFFIKIKDTGVGISKAYIPSLFDKFSQEEAGYTRRYEGSGLGLALVKKYCEINDIEISVSSEKGVGTIFTLEIPITRNKSIPA